MTHWPSSSQASALWTSNFPAGDGFSLSASSTPAGILNVKPPAGWVKGSQPKGIARSASAGTRRRMRVTARSFAEGVGSIEERSLVIAEESHFGLQNHAEPLAHRLPRQAHQLDHVARGRS